MALEPQPGLIPERPRSIERTPEILEMARQYKGELLQRMSATDSFSAFAAGETPRGTSSSNLVGIGFGAKGTDDGSLEEELAVRVYVRTKLALRDLPEVERIPPQINGLPTDVIAVGDLRAQVRPTRCGVSVGHFAITAGTLGCLVRRPQGPNDEVFILSNNHVLANSNAANIGDDILEPGPLDGGDPNDPIARLEDFEPLSFGGPINHFDAAIARVLQPGDVIPQILSIGAVAAPVMASSLFQSVRKRGRTTLHTVGVILDLSADIRVRYGTQLAFFEDQLSISGVNGQFSDGGDSGSLIVDAVSRRPVALLFAGGGNSTFACVIQQVLDRFQIEIV